MPAAIIYADAAASVFHELVYAINSELNSTEIYDNRDLFRALWPKLLDATITEAITECKGDRQVHAVGPAASQLVLPDKRGWVV